MGRFGGDRPLRIRWGQSPKDSVLATLPISVKGGEPSGAISGAEFESVVIVDGKAYLGVSVCTNSEVKVRGEGEDGGW